MRMLRPENMACFVPVIALPTDAVRTRQRRRVLAPPARMWWSAAALDALNPSVIGGVSRTGSLESVIDAGASRGGTFALDQARPERVLEKRPGRSPLRSALVVSAVAGAFVLLVRFRRAKKGSAERTEAVDIVSVQFVFSPSAKGTVREFLDDIAARSQADAASAMRDMCRALTLSVRSANRGSCAIERAENVSAGEETFRIAVERVHQLWESKPPADVDERSSATKAGYAVAILVVALAGHILNGKPEETVSATLRELQRVRDAELYAVDAMWFPEDSCDTFLTLADIESRMPIAE